MATPVCRLELLPQISPAQCAEVWKTRPHEAAMRLLARMIALPEFEDDPLTTVWVEFVYQLLLFGKENQLTPAKTLAFFGVVAETNAAAVVCADAETMTRQSCLKHFADRLLAITKEAAPADRFTVPEVKLVTGFFQTTYVPTLKLHQYVFTREQVERQSEAELFIHTPAPPPPLAHGVDVASLPPAEPPAAAPAAEAPAMEAADAPSEEAAAPPAPAPPVDPLAAAINANVDQQVAALKAQMEQEFAAQEQVMLERIAALETKLSGKAAK